VLVVEDPGRGAVVELVVDDGGAEDEDEDEVEVVPPSADVVDVELASVDEVELDEPAPGAEDDDVLDVDVLAAGSEEDDVEEAPTVVDVDVLGSGADVVDVVLVDVVAPPPLGALVDQAPR
jgi:hypothetical protein